MNLRAASQIVNPHYRSRRGKAAFSLIEIMVAVSLLTVIILGLIMMFNQTQHAFQAGTTQTDVLEAGRGAINFIRGELEEMTPAKFLVTNFYVGNRGLYLGQQLPPTSANLYRSNALEEFFFLQRENQNWKGIGYFVSVPNVNVPVGTLYRHETDPNVPDLPGYFTNFWSYAYANSLLPNGNVSTNLHRVLDGVVSLRVVPCNLSGAQMVPSTNYNNNFLFLSNLPLPPLPLISDRVGDYQAFLSSNVVPAYVDLEIGILEPRVLGQFRAIPNVNAQQAFLSRQAGKVHLFRQRIPIRNVDPQAYQ